MDVTVLNQRLDTLAGYPGVDVAGLERIGAILRQLDDWELFRINPLRFAATHNLDAKTVVDLFVHGVKFGLFDFSWNLICPACGGIEYSQESFSDIHISGDGLFHCTICDLDVSAEIDDQVEVAFTINKATHPLTLGVYHDSAHYQRYHRSANIERSPEFSAYMCECLRAFEHLAPMQSAVLELELRAGSEHRLTSYECHALLKILTTDRLASDTRHVDIALTPQGFVPDRLELDAGPVALHLTNKTPGDVGLLMFLVEWERMMQLVQQYPGPRHDFLTGKMLFNNQVFRDLFKAHSASQSMHLQIRSLTLLFTDLKGSTAMYDEAGDLRAYDLVREHFDVLYAAVRAHNGAVVKTMGDAIMATFSTPHEGLQAALAMQGALRELNRGWQREGHDLGLKVGLHEGPAMVVSANEQLDYFGQTVNVAARVQGLAVANEICLSEPVYQSERVRALIEALGATPQQQEVALKGVGQPTRVLRLDTTDLDLSGALA